MKRRADYDDVMTLWEIKKPKGCTLPPINKDSVLIPSSEANENAEEIEKASDRSHKNNGSLVK